jgi:nitrogen regulatory protein P-II 1
MYVPHWNVRASVKGIMITDIIGSGNQKGIQQVWRGEKNVLDLIPKVMLDMVVRDHDVGGRQKGPSGIRSDREYGDGKIFIYPVEEVIRIRTGEEGEKAL